MSQPPSTIETLYSQGPIESFPGIGPQRRDLQYVEYKEQVLGKDHIKKGKVRPLRGNSGVESLDQQHEDPGYWYGSLISFMIITAIVIVIVLIMASVFYRDIYSEEVYRPYGQRYEPPQQGLFFTLTILSSLLLIGAAHRGNLNLRDNGLKYILILIMAINLILLILWSFLFFNSGDSRNAFLVSIILGLTVIGWSWLVSLADRLSSGLLVLYLVFVIYLGWISWDRLQDDLYYSESKK